MTCNCLCQTEETETMTSDFEEPGDDKEKLTKKQVTSNCTKNGTKNQRALADAVLNGDELQNDLVENKTNRSQTVLAAKDKEDQSEDTDKLALHEIWNNFLTEGIPGFWIDRYKMQNSYSLKAKGWKVHMEWRESSIRGAGVGAFVKEDVEKGQLVRLAKAGNNLIRFREKSDLPKNPTPVTVNYVSNYCGQVDDFTMIFLPGNCFNHSVDANVIMVPVDEETIHIVASHNIKAGTELTQDYYSFGTPPKYLEEFATKYNIGLVFSGYNEYL